VKILKSWIKSEALQQTIEIWWLPAVLTILLVAQTTLFNTWLNIIPQLYKIRRSAAAVGLSALAFGPAIFLNRRGRHIYLFVASFLIAMIFIFEFVYYKYSAGYLEFSALFYAKQTGELWGTIRTLLTWKLLAFTVSPLLVIASFFSAKKPFSSAGLSEFGQAASGQTNAESGQSIWRKSISALALIVLFVGGYGTLLAAEKHDWGDTSRLYSQIYDLGTLVGKEGVVNYFLEDAIQYMAQSKQLTPQDKTEITAFAAQRPTPTAATNDASLLKSRNVFFIQLESFEDWVVNASINGQEITPTLNSLAKQGMYFPNYYSQIGEGNTADAEFSTLNSLYPLPDTVVFITHPADSNNFDALPSVLGQNGYTTAVMHGDIATFWNRSNNYPGLGYNDQFSSMDYTESRPIGFDGLGDSDFFSQSLSKIQNLKQPFMATLITLSSHTPFVIPKDLQTLSIPENSSASTQSGSIQLISTLEDYVQSVHYTDASLGAFMDSLKAAGLYNNSLFVIYGDHNAFISTSDSQTNHVPMVLFAPNSSLTGINTEPSSHIDLFPTVTNLVGVKTPKTVLGQDLLNTKTPVVTQRNTGSGTIKFIISSTLKYTASTDGDYEHGNCLSWPELTTLAVDDCKTLYNQQAQTIQVSDLVVRYNQLPLLAGSQQ
jgi:phosphoglycerol transferase MdoB-like AlkP superfamily enzyme